ncbi:MAG: hypothetical protein GW893_08285 [Armatimonadetes bacterium]|nr:hypothetical protein [Armatimonadota bacterium]
MQPTPLSTGVYLIFGDPNAESTEKKVTLKVVTPMELFSVARTPSGGRKR